MSTKYPYSLWSSPIKTYKCLPPACLQFKLGLQVGKQRATICVGSNTRPRYFSGSQPQQSGFGFHTVHMTRNQISSQHDNVSISGDDDHYIGQLQLRTMVSWVQRRLSGILCWTPAQFKICCLQRTIPITHWTLSKCMTFSRIFTADMNLDFV